MKMIWLKIADVADMGSEVVESMDSGGGGIRSDDGVVARRTRN